MRIVGLGSDIAEVGRIRASRERFGDRFLERVYTPREIAYAMSKANRDERLAGRFAAKEAGMKALGTGLSGGITWRDISVAREASGKPTLVLTGAAKARAEALGVVHAHVTITHTSELAMAVVILEGL
jgi:holo-[acyl-carrier protein] synthase